MPSTTPRKSSPASVRQYWGPPDAFCSRVTMPACSRSRRRCDIKAGDIRGTPFRSSLKRLEPHKSSRRTGIVQCEPRISAAIARGRTARNRFALACHHPFFERKSAALSGCAIQFVNLFPITVRRSCAPTKAMKSHMSITLAKLSGNTILILGERLDALKARVRGMVLTKHDKGYGAARSVWNA